jgi:hypothetical protein
MYLLAEWGSQLPYRRPAELLNEMLPGLNRKIGQKQDACKRSISPI